MPAPLLSPELLVLTRLLPPELPVLPPLLPFNLPVLGPLLPPELPVLPLLLPPELLVLPTSAVNVTCNDEQNHIHRTISDSSGRVAQNEPKRRVLKCGQC